jgi:phosphate transport system substrate-binding protein
MSFHPHPLILSGCLAFAGPMFGAGVPSENAPPSAAARAVAALPSYRPAVEVAGTVRLWGHGSPKHVFMRDLVARWQAGIARFQPNLTIEYDMYGTGSAIGALYTGAGDVAILGEEISAAAATAFARIRHYPPREIDVATGSLDVRFFDYAQVIFVHRDNPLARLTLAQLDGIFGEEHRRGTANLRTWGQLGLTGAWANRPIVPYGWELADSFATYFQDTVMDGSHRWNARLRQFPDRTNPDGSVADQGQQILDALAQNPAAIGVSNLRFANPQVKAVALAVGPGGPYFAATQENLIRRTYPLTRIIPAYIDQPPGRPVDPKVREFLRYVLSREGQSDLLHQAGYLPLSAESARSALAKLDDRSAPAAVDVELRAQENGRPRPLGASAPGVEAAGAAGGVGAPRLRIWGSVEMAAISGVWQEGFRRAHPDATFSDRLLGTDSAMAGLYTGMAELGYFGRAVTPAEIQAFEWRFTYKPVCVEIMTGSVAAPGPSPALAVFVRRDNPLTSLTLPELRAIFADAEPAETPGIRTWGELGLTGPRARHPIHLYTYDFATGRGVFFRDRALGGERQLAWPRLREYRDLREADGRVAPAGARILAALAADPDGLAVSELGYAEPAVRTVGLRAAAGAPAVTPSADQLISRAYPLTRSIYAVFNRVPGRPADPRVRAFLRYVLSGEGQRLIARAGGYLPLNPALAAAERRKLE